MAKRYYKARPSNEHGIVFDYYGDYDEQTLLSRFGSEEFKKLYKAPTDGGAELIPPSDAQVQAELERIKKDEGLIQEKDRPDYIGKLNPLKFNEEGRLVPRPEEEITAAKEKVAREAEAAAEQREKDSARQQYKDIDRETGSSITDGTFTYDRHRFSMSIPAQLNWNRIMNSYINNKGVFQSVVIISQPTADGEYVESEYTLVASKVSAFFKAYNNKVSSLLEAGRAKKIPKEEVPI